jgi:hypothetical protein
MLPGTGVSFKAKTWGPFFHTKRTDRVRATALLASQLEHARLDLGRRGGLLIAAPKTDDRAGPALPVAIAPDLPMCALTRDAKLFGHVCNWATQTKHWFDQQ